MSQEPDRREEIAYGLEIFSSTLLNFTLFFLVALWLGWTAEFLIYLAFFALMRNSAGGHHAKNHLLCCAEYGSVCFGGIWLARTWLFLAPELCLATGYTLALFLVERYAPATHPNRPVSQREYIKFRKRSRLVLYGVLPALMLVKALHPVYACTGLIAIVTEALSIIHKKGGQPHEKECTD